MFLIYEKKNSEIIEGKDVDTFNTVEEKDATHIHKCRHDEEPQGRCSREKI